jgi:hypothetical protein
LDRNLTDPILRFLLNLDGDAAPSFLVRKETGITALMVASSNMSADPRLPEVLRLLLEKFGTAELINTRATRLYRSTALQSAVQVHNVAAIKALVKAGADVAVLDTEGASLLDIATGSLQKLLRGQSELSKRDLDRDISRALETISLVSEVGSWPSQCDWGTSIASMLAVAKPLMDLMMTIPHWKSRALDFDLKLGRIVQRYMRKFPEDLPSMEEFRRQLDQALQPLFFAELFFGISSSTEIDIRTLGCEDNGTYETVISRLPMLKNLSLPRFTDLQQAAAFEYILDYVRTHPTAVIKEGRSYEWESFRSFVESGDETKLPIHPRYIRYPQSLLFWYSKAVEDGILALETGEDRARVAYFVEILKQRASAQRKGLKTFPDFDSEFRAFHFRELQPRVLNFHTLHGTILMRTECRCKRKEIGGLSIEYLRYMNQCIGKGFELATQDQKSWEKKSDVKLKHDNEMNDLRKIFEQQGLDPRQTIRKDTL